MRRTWELLCAVLLVSLVVFSTWRVVRQYLWFRAGQRENPVRLGFQKDKLRFVVPKQSLVDAKSCNEHCVVVERLRGVENFGCVRGRMKIVRLSEEIIVLRREEGVYHESRLAEYAKRKNAVLGVSLLGDFTLIPVEWRADCSEWMGVRVGSR
jgi:hypothetical protein